MTCTRILRVPLETPHLVGSILVLRVTLAGSADTIPKRCWADAHRRISRSDRCKDRSIHKRASLDCRSASPIVLCNRSRLSSDLFESLNTNREETTNDEKHSSRCDSDHLWRLDGNRGLQPRLRAAAGLSAQHPVVERVLIEGDTAMLQFKSSKPEEAGVIRSVDVFVYKDCHWRGLYSSRNKVA
jgi:hypothetical protein